MVVVEMVRPRKVHWRLSLQAHRKLRVERALQGQTIQDYVAKLIEQLAANVAVPEVSQSPPKANR